jgi:hypothetical protein
MKIPKTQKGKVILIRAELSSGIILNNDDSYYLKEGENYYMIFENLDEAKTFAKNNSEDGKAHFESLIYNDSGIFIEIVR